MTQNPWNKKTYHSKKQRKRIGAGRNEKNKMQGMWISKKEKRCRVCVCKRERKLGEGWLEDAKVVTYKFITYKDARV